MHQRGRVAALEAMEPGDMRGAVVKGAEHPRHILGGARLAATFVERPRRLPFEVDRHHALSAGIDEHLAEVVIAMDADVGGRRAGVGKRFKLGADPLQPRGEAREPGGERRRRGRSGQSRGAENGAGVGGKAEAKRAAPRGRGWLEGEVGIIVARGERPVHPCRRRAEVAG